MQTWEPLRPPHPPVLSPGHVSTQSSQANPLAHENSSLGSVSLLSPSPLPESLQMEGDTDLGARSPSSATVGSSDSPLQPQLNPGPAPDFREPEADPISGSERTLTASPPAMLQRQALNSTFDRISILSPQSLSLRPSSDPPSLQAQLKTTATPTGSQLQKQEDPNLGQGQQVVVPRDDINDRRQILIQVFIEVYGLSPEEAAQQADWNINNAGEACRVGSELFRVGSPVEQNGRYVVTVEPAGYCGGDVYAPSTPSSPITQDNGSPGSSSSSGSGSDRVPDCDPIDYAIVRVESSGEGFRFTLPGINRTISLPTRSWQMTEYDHVEVIRQGGERQRFERGSSVGLFPGDTIRIPLYDCPAPGNEPTESASTETADEAIEIIRQTDPRSEPVGDQPQMLMNPPVQEAVPGTRITYTLHIPRPPSLTPRPQDPYSYQWSVINDLSQHPDRQETFNPRQRSAVWENAQWDFTGNHTVVCRVEGEGRRFEIHYVQTVRDLRGLTQDTLDQIPEDQDYVGFRTGLELKHLELSQRGIPNQDFGIPSISNSGPNPAVPGRAPDLDSHTYTITPSSQARSFRWTVAPQDPLETQNFHGFQRSEENGQEIYDLNSTGTSARWIISHRNVYTLRCEEFDQTGQPLGTTARYVQTVMAQDEADRVERFRDYLGDVSQSIDQIAPGQEVAIRAAYVQQESAAQTSLALFIGPDANDPSRVQLVDLTPGVSRIEYGGRDTEGALDAFARGNSYPHGQILLEIPANDAGIPPLTREIEPNGRSWLQGAAENTGWASLGLAGLGLLALTNPVTAVAAPYLFVASAGAGGVSAGLSLADELQQANPSGLSIGIDVAGLASSILGGAAAFRAIRQGAAVTVASQTGRFLIYSGFTADAISGVLLSVEGVEQINQILNAEGMSPRQQADAIARILANLAINGGLLAYGARDLRSGQFDLDLSNRYGGTVLNGLEPQQRNLVDDIIRYRRAGNPAEADRVLGQLRNSVDPNTFNQIESLVNRALSGAELDQNLNNLRRDGGVANEEALNDFVGGLPEVEGVGVDGSVSRESLQTYAAQQLGLPPEQLTVRSVREASGGEGAVGVSGAPVFIVRNTATNENIAIIKIFPEADELGGELMALQRLNGENFEQVNAPEVLGVGRGSGNQGVMITSVAPGQAVDSLMLDVGRLTGPARQDAFANLRRAVESTGRALAELHTVPQGSGGPVVRSFFEKHIRAVNEITTKIIGEINGGTVQGLDPGELQARVDTLVTAFEANPGASALVHGDAHPGNFFFDPEAGTTLIDTPTLNLSMAPDGTPIGTPARDFGNFEQKLASFGRNYGLTDGEIADLQQAFRRAYQEANGAEMTEEAIRFFRVRAAGGEVLKAVRAGDQEAIANQVDLFRQALGLD